MNESLMLLAPPRQVSIDEQLASQIRKVLAEKPRMAGSKVRVEVEAGIVTLRGSASSFYQKQLWLHGIKRCPGVRGIVDKVEVHSQAS